MPERHSGKGRLTRRALVFASLGLLIVHSNQLSPPLIQSPAFLDHGLAVGFSYSADEARGFLGQSDPEKLFEELCKRFATTSTITSRNWVRTSWRQSNSDDQNLKDLDFQYNLADKYNLDVYQIIGADQCFNPNRFPPSSLSGLSLDDPKYIDGCIKENERNFAILQREGFLTKPRYIILGNESRTIFPDRPIPFSSMVVLTALKELADGVSIPTIANDFCSPQDYPQKSWQEIQTVADVVAIDLYSQVGEKLPDLDRTIANLKLFKASSRKPMIVLEAQTRRWSENLPFASQDQKNLFYLSAPFVNSYGFWEADKLVVFAKRFGNYYGDQFCLKALEDNIAQADYWNRKFTGPG